MEKRYDVILSPLSAECPEPTPKTAKAVAHPLQPNYEGCEASLLIDSMNHRSPIKDHSSVLATVNLLHGGR